MSKLSSAQRELLHNYTRDMSVCMPEEILVRWNERDIEALARAGISDFHARLENHNPIYYLAERVFFNNVRSNKKFLYAPLHRDRLCKKIWKAYNEPEGGSAGLLTLMMRGSYKSTFFHGVVPLWIVLREWYLNNYNVHLALIHQKEDKASANLVRLKSKTLGHEWFKATWPEFASNSDYGTKTQFTWKPEQGKVRYASEESVFAGGINADLTGWHFDHIFFSDLVVAKHITSQQERTMTKKKHDAIMYTVLSGKPWYDGTRYHIRDLYGDMISATVENSKLYDVFHVQAIENDDSLSMPFKYSLPVLERMRQKEISRSGNDLLWHLQMQNNVHSSHFTVADINWIQRVPLEKIRPGGFRVITVDPAWKGSLNQGEGDFASIQVWNLERRGSLILYTLLDGVHSNELTDRDGIREIFRLMSRYGTDVVAPEERGGFSFRTNLEAEALTRGKSITIIALETMQAGKQQRMGTFISQAQARKVFIAMECNKELVEAFLNQFVDFPQLDHDDALDAAAYVCDPAIAKRFMPMFNENDDDIYDEPVRASYTRHCNF